MAVSDHTDGMSKTGGMTALTVGGTMGWNDFYRRRDALNGVISGAKKRRTTPATSRR